MNRPHIISALVLFSILAVGNPEPAHAQFGKLKDKIKQKVDEKVKKGEEKVDQKIDCALGEIFRDGKCVKADESSSSGSGGSSNAAKPSTASAEKKAAAKPGQGAWANFDFVPGEKPLFVEDFTRDRVGNFPKRLQLHSGNFEVVEWEGKRWLRSGGQGQFEINIPGGLPERWTMEFDVTVPWWAMYIYPGAPSSGYPGDRQFIELGVSGRVSGGGEKVTSFDMRTLFGNKIFDESSLTRPMRVRLHADGAYMKVYIEDIRIANMPNMGKWTGSRINIQTRENTNGGKPEGALITNISFNAGGKDMYDALSADGRLALQGIYFDVGSDRIRPESSGTLSEIAEMMEEHGELKLTIEGHTDNVGDAAANQRLSQARAAAVMSALAAAPYNVSGDRLKSAGVGAAKPVKPNDTPEGRQANRRVELVVQK